MIRKGYRYLLTAVIAASAAALLTFAARNDFGLGRNMEITVNMMRELSLGYVDPVDPDKLMEGAAEGMVSDLDPYTEFIPEDQMSNFELLTTGKYGGVGSLIRKKGDWVTIAQPYKGSPADRAGLKIGDKILAIDGKDAKGFTTEQVSSRLKGDPGSKVRVTVEHLTRPSPCNANGSPFRAYPTRDGWPKASGTSATAISPKVVTRICGRPSNGCVRRAN